MRLSPTELRDAIEAAADRDLFGPLVRDADVAHRVNIDGDLNLVLLAEANSERLDANIVGRGLPPARRLTLATIDGNPE